MASAFARRFQLIVDQLAQGNKKQFAEQTGKSASHIYKICRGASRPSMAYLESLYEEFKVDLNWLLTGEQSEGSQPTGSAPDKELVYAPMFDVQASAGFGSAVLAEDISDYFAFTRTFLSRQLGVSGESLAFVSIRGDSMLPTLQDSDQVLVDTTRKTVQHEGLYLIHTEDGLMAKRLKPGKEEVKVISDNPEYPGWAISGLDHETNQVVGKIVWCARSM
ncbi:helix-turn-helix domain-containing protein [Sansalvadorimonas sp. 2012CJ34-2]|uniref:Helix-turn-helix domain-containing protein n=1 Tax=Parendozoicomonas callyspongiae TaxID=2942213 RepID=A0ABT0PE78_9GAMM|nr:S24 family peptidase [Sansalvadorimonas sp. 2012CJ34-2]MCL6269667.1 helix-turn-helix domain-containing protein [Sansalvadorimonas sp. 2012CJ34-2]